MAAPITEHADKLFAISILNKTLKNSFSETNSGTILEVAIYNGAINHDTAETKQQEHDPLSSHSSLGDSMNRKTLTRSLLILIAATSLFLGTSVAFAGGNGNGNGTVKVDVCHIPPGNPDNAHTITVGEPAVDAHLAHGDFLGHCDAAAPTGPSTTNPDGGEPEPIPTHFPLL